VLKNLGGEMDDEIKRQTPIIDAIDNKLARPGELISP
jgi:hypothetical protein